MPKYEITAPDGKTLVIEGPRPPTQDEAAKLFARYKAERVPSLGESIAGGAEVAAAMATGAIAEPLSGLVGLARTAISGPEAGAQRVREFQENTTYQPRTEIGQRYMQNVAEAPIISDIAEMMQSGSQYAGQKTFEATGSPLAASLAQAAPETIASALGAKAPQAPLNRLGDRIQTERDMRAGADSAEVVTDETGQIGSTIRKAGKKGDFEQFRNLAEIIDADPEFFEALDALGVTEKPLASYASNNPQFRGIEQAFAAMPSSPQAEQALRFSKDVSAVANALDEKYTTALGSVDASLKWRDASLKSIDQLGEAAHEAWTALGESMNRRVAADAKSTQAFIDEYAENLALGRDDPDVDPIIKDAIRSLSPRQSQSGAMGVQVVPPTYENMDKLRKKVGAALYRKEGEFKDADSGLLKKLYTTLTEDTERMAEAQGLVDQVQAAKALTRQQKQMQERVQSLVGDKLQKDIVPVIQSGIKGLANGGAQKYKQLMAAIPEPEVRKELVYNAISDTFKKTIKAEKNQFDNTAYLKWYNKTLGNKAVRDLMEKDLPEGSLNDFDNLAKIAEGIGRATSQKVSTGVVNSILKDQFGFVGKLLKRGATAAAGADIGALMIDLAEKGDNRAAAASALLSDSRLQRLVANGYAAGKRADRMNQAIEKSLKKEKTYQKWFDTLSQNEQRQIESLGLTQFLTQQPQEEQQQ
jgi:hypothetical protein